MLYPPIEVSPEEPGIGMTHLRCGHLQFESAVGRHFGRFSRAIRKLRKSSHS